MDTKLAAQVRKHALRRKITTGDWSEEQILAYAEEHNIRASGNHRPTAAPARVTAEEIEEAIVEARQPKITPVPAKAGTVDQAIADLISAMDLKSKAEIDETRVIELIEQHSKRVIVEIRDSKTGEVRNVEGTHKEFPTVMNCIAAGVNIAAVGPAGSGKSTIFEQAARELKIDYYFTGAVQQEHKIMGFVDANGTYHRTQFRDAFEHGGLFVMEEFDGSGARAMLAINNAAANEWCDFPDGKVAKHKDFVLVMAGNTYGTGASRQYVGRQQLDAATLDRFAFIEIGYDEDLEEAITLAYNKDAGPWVKRVQAFRHKVEQAGIRHVVSPRASIMGAKLLKQGLPEQKVVELTLHKGLSRDQINQLK